VTGELLCQCGCRIVEWVHGHGQCQNCKRNVFPCCSGEVAEASYAEHKRFWMDEVIREASVEMNQTRHCEVADGLPGAAAADCVTDDALSAIARLIGGDVGTAVIDSETACDHRFYADNGDRAVTSAPRPCVCHGLLDLAYCGICGTANICESEPDVDDVVKAA
jgi:hypothetical protein